MYHEPLSSCPNLRGLPRSLCPWDLRVRGVRFGSTAPLIGERGCSSSVNFRVGHPLLQVRWDQDEANSYDPFRVRCITVTRPRRSKYGFVLSQLVYERVLRDQFRPPPLLFSQGIPTQPRASLLLEDKTIEVLDQFQTRLHDR